MSSCAGLKKSDSHSKENIMKVDAYAKAQVECEYELVKLKSLDNPTDVELKNEFTKLTEDVTILRQTFFKRYQDPEEDYVQFQKLVKKATPVLSVCRKVTEYKEAKEKQEKEEAKKDN